MAKKQRRQTDTAADLPRVELDDESKEEAPEANAEPEAVVSVDPAESVEPTPTPPPIKVSVLTISIPTIEITGYARKRIDVSLTGNQAAKLKSMQHGLESQNAQLLNGRYVSTPMHAVQWLIENAESN